MGDVVRFGPLAELVGQRKYLDESGKSLLVLVVQSIQLGLSTVLFDLLLERCFENKQVMSVPGQLALPRGAIRLPYGFDSGEVVF